MSKSRFNKRRSALKPEWILEGSQSGSATPTATLSDGIHSRPSSSKEQQTTAPTSKNEGDKDTEESVKQRPSTPPAGDATPHAVETTPHTVQAQLPPSSGAKTKSRYSKAHAAAWTVPSTEGNIEPNSASPHQKMSKLKSWTRKFMGDKMSTDKPMDLPSPKSNVPPAPTQPRFAEADVPSSLRNHDSGRDPYTQSPSSGADVPARAPYIASNYTPTCSPAY